MHKYQKIQLCLKMWFSTSIDITWYAEAVICAKNLFHSCSIVFYWNLVNEPGTKCDKGEWGEKCHYASDIFYEWPHV